MANYKNNSTIILILGLATVCVAKFNLSSPELTHGTDEPVTDNQQPTILIDTTIITNAEITTSPDTTVDNKRPTTLIDTTTTSNAEITTSRHTTVDNKRPTTLIDTTVTSNAKTTTNKPVTDKPTTSATTIVTSTKIPSTTQEIVTTTVIPAVPTAEEQCKLRGYVKRCRVPLCSVCYNLLCKTSVGPRAATGRARDGTVCGKDNVCKQGKCVKQQSNSTSIGESVICALREIFLSRYC